MKLNAKILKELIQEVMLEFKMPDGGMDKFDFEPEHPEEPDSIENAPEGTGTFKYTPNPKAAQEWLLRAMAEPMRGE